MRTLFVLPPAMRGVPRGLDGASSSEKPPMFVGCVVLSAAAAACIADDDFHVFVETPRVGRRRAGLCSAADGGQLLGACSRSPRRGAEGARAPRCARHNEG